MLAVLGGAKKGGNGKPSVGTSLRSLQQESLSKVKCTLYLFALYVFSHYYLGILSYTSYLYSYKFITFETASYKLFL